MRSRVWSRNNFFVRFIVSYLSVLLITILIGALAYQGTLRIYKQETIRNGLLTLEEGKELVDARFNEMQNIITQLMLDDQVKSVFDTPLPLQNSDYYQFSMLQKKLSTYKLTNAFINELFLYISNPNVIISSNYTTDRVPDYYNYFMNYKSMSVPVWEQKMMGTYHYMDIWPADKITRENQENEYLTFVQSYPIESYTRYTGVVGILIRNSDIMQYFNTIDTIQGSTVIVLDKQNHVLTSNRGDDRNEIVASLGTHASQEIKLGGQRAILLQTESSIRNWKFIATIPNSYFEQKASTIKRMFGMTVLLILAVGMLSAGFMAYRNSAPLRKITERLNAFLNDSEVKPVQDYNFLEGTVSRFIDYHNHLKDQIEQQIPLIQTSFMERLLKGGFSNSQDMRRALAHSRIQLENGSWMVILMKINGFDSDLSEEDTRELDIAKTIASNEWRSQNRRPLLLHTIDNDKIAALWGPDTINDESIHLSVEHILSQTAQRLDQQYSIRVIFGIGSSCLDLMDISRSYREAVRSIEYKPSNMRQRIIWYDQIPDKNAGYWYPLEEEMRLMNLVKSGDERSVLMEIDSLKSRNFERKRLSEQDMIQFYYEMRGTVLKVTDEIYNIGDSDRIEAETMLKHLDTYESSEQLFDRLNDLYKHLCRTVLDRRKSRTNELVERIIQFIIQHYREADLGLYSVASEFELTEKYLSQFFKEQTGENFAAYIEKIRLEQALELMKQPELTIHEIAIMTGYDKDNTFYRAFKRKYGVTPTTYRNRL